MIIKIDFKLFYFYKSMQAYNISEYDVLKGGKIYSHLIGKYFEESQNDLVLRDEFRNIEFDIYVDFDGCDSNGPESYLYTMLVKWNDKKKRKFAHVWYRENWFKGEDTDQFEMLNYVPVPFENKMDRHILAN
jgi:hypothetical protein